MLMMVRSLSTALTVFECKDICVGKAKRMQGRGIAYGKKRVLEQSPAICLPRWQDLSIGTLNIIIFF